MKPLSESVVSSILSGSTPATVAAQFLDGRPIAGLAFDHLVTVEVIEGLLRKRLEALLKRKAKR